MERRNFFKPEANGIIESGSQVVDRVDLLISKLDDVILLSKDVSTQLSRPKSGQHLSRGRRSEPLHLKPPSSSQEFFKPRVSLPGGRRTFLLSPSLSPIPESENSFFPARYPSAEDREAAEEELALASLQKHRGLVFEALRERRNKLEMLADVLKRNGSIACVECAVEMRRRDILFDLLSALARNQKIWNLDLCQVVLPVLEHLLDSKEEDYVLVGCSVLKLILVNFGGFIKLYVRKSPHKKDVAGGERYVKSLDCFRLIRSLFPIIERLKKTSGEVKHKISEIEFILYALD